MLSAHAETRAQHAPPTTLYSTPGKNKTFAMAHSYPCLLGTTAIALKLARSDCHQSKSNNELIQGLPGNGQKISLSIVHGTRNGAPGNLLRFCIY
jgi:hypothetical protein